jgi:hypothetical protein
LRVSRTIAYVGLVLLCIANHLSIGQHMTRGDTLRSSGSSDSVRHEQNTSHLRFTGELDYSVTFSNLLLVNWLHEKNADQIMGLQNLKYRMVIENAHSLSISNLFIHNLGFQSYFDSITKVYLDDNTLTTKIDLRIKKNLSFVFNSNLTTQCLQGFDYGVNDSGKQVLLLNSAFLTPLVWTFSLGAGMTWKDFGSLTLGLTGGKLTYIRQTRIFSIRHITEFWGVSQGKNPLLEYGLSLQFLVNKDFLKRVHWDCDLLLFKNYNASLDLNFKNLIGIRINKFFKTSIQTRLFYEEKVSKNIQLENLVSIGLYVHL